MGKVSVISESPSSNERFLFIVCWSVVGGISVSRVYSEVKLLRDASLAHCQGVGTEKLRTLFNKANWFELAVMGLSGMGAI